MSLQQVCGFNIDIYIIFMWNKTFEKNHMFLPTSNSFWLITSQLVSFEIWPFRQQICKPDQLDWCCVYIYMPENSPIEMTNQPASAATSQHPSLLSNQNFPKKYLMLSRSTLLVLSQILSEYNPIVVEEC